MSVTIGQAVFLSVVPFFLGLTLSSSFLFFVIDDPSINAVVSAPNISSNNNRSSEQSSSSSSSSPSSSLSHGFVDNVTDPSRRTRERCSGDVSVSVSRKESSSSSSSSTTTGGLEKRDEDEEGESQVVRIVNDRTPLTDPNAPRRVTFVNTARDARLRSARLFFRNQQWGRLGHGEAPIAVQTYRGQEWFVKAWSEDGREEVSLRFVVGDETHRLFLV